MNPAQGVVERPGGTTFKGSPLTLLGPELKPGDKAPDFEAIDKTMQPVNLAKTAGEVRIFSVVPSLDTPVCDMQTKRFNEEVRNSGGIKVYTISMDLPFAQARWCGAFGVDDVTMLSDHRDASFGLAYGTLIKEWRILSRAIFVVDRNDVVQYSEYVKEVAEHPNYEAALAKARELAG
jgi:thiol peroxidase